MRIGYSCWGFLGNGILDTPDGGRSHRLTLLNELIKQGSTIVMLQENRDYTEVKQDFSEKNLFFNSGFPNIDALFLEYRWIIPGRNVGVDINNSAYTPDFDRQNELLEFYQNKNIPIIVWDKDQKLGLEEGKKIKNSIIFEPALHPRFQRKRLLFPMNEHKKEKAYNQIENYSENNRNVKLVYIGNQYERDNDFREFINKPAGQLLFQAPVFGNWNKYPDKYRDNVTKFSNVDFKGRVEFNKIDAIYKKSLATVIIAPDRYYKTGHFTQRLFEAMFGLCIPLTPNKYSGLNEVITKDFIVDSGSEVARKINEFENRPITFFQETFKEQFKLLDIFKPSSQARIILDAIRDFYE